MKKTVTVTLIGLLSFCVFSCPVKADNWREDAEIDRKYGFIERAWSVPLSRIRSWHETTSRIKSALPPYTQQPEQAQRVQPPAPVEGPTPGKR